MGPSQGRLGADRGAGTTAPRKSRVPATRPELPTPAPPSQGYPHWGLSYLCPRCPARCGQDGGRCCWHLRGWGGPGCPAGRPRGCRRGRGRRACTGPGGSGPACPGCGGTAAARASPGRSGQVGEGRAGVAPGGCDREGGISPPRHLTVGPHVATGLSFSIKWEVAYVRGLFLTESWGSDIEGRWTGGGGWGTGPGPTWLSSKTGLSGSESLPLPPLALPPRDKGLLWDGEPASDGGGLSVSTSSGFVPSMGTSVFPPLLQAETRSFRDSGGRKGAGPGVKARYPTPNQLRALWRGAHGSWSSS